MSQLKNMSSIKTQKEKDEAKKPQKQQENPPLPNENHGQTEAGKPEEPKK